MKAAYKAIFYKVEDARGERTFIEPIYGRTQEGIIASAKRKLAPWHKAYSYDVLERDVSGVWQRIIVGARVWQ